MKIYFGGWEPDEDSEIIDSEVKYCLGLRHLSNTTEITVVGRATRGAIAAFTSNKKIWEFVMDPANRDQGKNKKLKGSEHGMPKIWYTTHKTSDEQSIGRQVALALNKLRETIVQKEAVTPATAERMVDGNRDTGTVWLKRKGTEGGKTDVYYLMKRPKHQLELTLDINAWRQANIKDIEPLTFEHDIQAAATR